MLGTPIRLNAGDRLRVVIANPFASSANNDHGLGGQNPYIAADTLNHLPIAKSIRIQLLDYNIN